jgi:hypothetical protein
LTVSVRQVASVVRRAGRGQGCPSVRQKPMRFRATIALLGINPYVGLPPARLKALLATANRTSGALPVQVRLGGATFRCNVVKYAGAWRLYLNMPMREAAGKDVGDTVLIEIEHDPGPRIEPMSSALLRELERNDAARDGFDRLTASRKKEILRYLNGARTTATLERNVGKVMAYLTGESAPGLAVLGPPARGTKAVARAKAAPRAKAKAKRVTRARPAK